MVTASDKKNVVIGAACLAVLTGLGVWGRRAQRARIAYATKNLTKLRFDLGAEAIEPECNRIISRMKAVDDAIAALPLHEVNFENTAQKLINLDADMLSCISNVSFLSHVSTNKDIRDACSKADEKIDHFLVERGMRVDVYEAIKALHGSSHIKELNAQQQRYVEKLIQDFQRNGLQLEQSKREELAAWKQKISKLGIQFQKNLAEETIALSFTIEELAGLSESFIKELERDEEDPTKYKIVLSYPTVFPILNTCSNPNTRKAVEYAFGRRCIDTNVPILEEMLSLRHQVATTLGYENHASFVLEQRMAKSAYNVKTFLAELDAKLTPLAKKDLDALLRLKDEECQALNIPFDGKINMWDFRYYKDQFMKKYYTIDSEKVREYFPLSHVTTELLAMYQELLLLRFIEIQSPHTWHKDVRMFAVHDQRPQKKGNLVGYFYLDLFPRIGKYGHAACFTLLQSCLGSDGVSRELPVAAMVANFNAPTKHKPSLLDHNEVVTFFHEFGHVMHCLCSEVDIPRFSGTRVERDFVEAPSQMLENWCWEKEPLQRLSSHYITKEPMDDSLVTRLISSRDVTTGLMNKRQVLFATLDQTLHSSPKSDSAKVLKQLQSEILLIDLTPGTNFVASFAHLTGGYDAQYYGYLWSEVFSMDMFQTRFKKEGLMNPQTGLAYREKILARGGTVDASVLLKDFLGREPTQEAFLRSKGLDM